MSFVSDIAQGNTGRLTGTEDQGIYRARLPYSPRGPTIRTAIATNIIQTASGDASPSPGASAKQPHHRVTDNEKLAC